MVSAESNCLLNGIPITLKSITQFPCFVKSFFKNIFSSIFFAPKQAKNKYFLSFFSLGMAFFEKVCYNEWKTIAYRFQIVEYPNKEPYHAKNY